MASIKKPLNLKFRNGGSENLSSSISSSDVLKFSAVSLVVTAVLTACGPKASAAQESRPPLTILFPDLETQKLNGPPIAIYSFKKEEIPASQVDFLNKTYGGEPLSLDAWVAMKIGPVIETKNESGDGMVTFETYTLDNGKQIVSFLDKNSQGKSTEYFAGKFGDDEGIYYSYYIKDPADSGKIYSFVTVRWDNQDVNKQALVEDGANPNDVFGDPTTINVINPLTNEEISYTPLTGQNVFFDMIGKIIEPSGVVQAQGLPTNTPEPTIPSVPMIEVGGLQIPDPKASNPELFDITNPNSPIVLFANAFGVKPEEVGAGLHTEMETPDGMPAFTVLRTADGVALVMATQDENGNWIWKQTNLGRYLGVFGKVVGASMDGPEWDTMNNSSLAIQAFSDGGVIGLLGQVRPGPDIDERKPSNAAKYLDKAVENNMGFIFNYVVEPGKFPKGTSTENVDQWIDTRLEGIANLIINNTNNDESRQPMYIQFNEATGDGNGWNRDNNPLKDKYGENWLGEYYYRLLYIFTNKGLALNKDYLLLNNENKMFTQSSQQFVHDKFIEARQYAYEKLISDPIMSSKLESAGIQSVEDIKIILGSQTYVNLDGRPSNGVSFINDPTKEEINQLANYFEDTGGVLFTEVSPHGSPQQQADFLAKILEPVKNNPNIRGILLWNIFNNTDDAKNKYMQSPLSLFNDDGSPTQIYFELLRESLEN